MHRCPEADNEEEVVSYEDDAVPYCKKQKVADKSSRLRDSSKVSCGVPYSDTEVLTMVAPLPHFCPRSGSSIPISIQSRYATHHIMPGNVMLGNMLGLVLRVLLRG